jgi:hypothetical protein
MFYVKLNLCPNNASYSQEENEKVLFSLSPSRIDLICRADRTCQVKHPVIKKDTQKYLKLNPPT